MFDHKKSSNFAIKITAASGASVTGLVYLGRPWRVYARVIYQFSALTAVVNAKGWAPMTANATPYVGLSHVRRFTR